MIVLWFRPCSAPAASPNPGSALPTAAEMAAARTDVWGDAALQLPDGPSYEFFRDLLPPVRWVNTEFRHYPIVLSAPFSAEKVRYVSNGGAINARARKPPMWYESGTPLLFHVGASDEIFGQDVTKLKDPEYERGFLPIVRVSYQQGETRYHEEVFAPVEPDLAARGAALLRFRITGSVTGRVETEIQTEGTVRVEQGSVVDEKGQAIVSFGPSWKWESQRKRLIASLAPEESADLLIFTKTGPLVSLSSNLYDECRLACERKWEEFVGRSIQLSTPEAIVNDAWRAMVIGDAMIAVNNRLHYSAGNAYAKLYQGECGDVLRSLLLFGYRDTAREALKPLLEFNRQATRFHVAGHKLQLLAWYYWITRDAESVERYEPTWRPFLDLILKSREAQTGLLPKDNFAGDIPKQVYSLNSNANCWRGLRDVAVMLDDMGRKDDARQLFAEAKRYRDAILLAVGKSERLDTQPPFIPVGLLSDEPAHDPLTATTLGSYYDLIAPYVLGSEIFGAGAEREGWLLGYLQKHGGIAMGMIRSTPHQGQYKDEPGANVLYGLRYQLTLLRRDDCEKALVGFYGQLAQAMTRSTFIGAEGTRFFHGDRDGRSMYLPPNSASNAMFLVTLRYLLIQDWDLDQDGRPDTLRLLYGIPRRWLQDGGSITFKNAPTSFGDVSLELQSHLSSGLVTVRITPPPRKPRESLLRVPLPHGFEVKSAILDGSALPIAKDGAVELPGRSDTYEVRFNVQPVTSRPP